MERALGLCSRSLRLYIYMKVNVEAHLSNCKFGSRNLHFRPWKICNCTVKRCLKPHPTIFLKYASKQTLESS